MAKLHKKNDGDFYITQGYPLTRKGSQETGFATYQVLPRAERFFALAEFREGEQLPKTIFYTLLIEHDITNPHLERVKPTVADIPRDMKNNLTALGGRDDGVLTNFAIRMTRESRLNLFQVYEMMLTFPDFSRDQRVNWAGVLSLFRHLRQGWFERERLSVRITPAQ